MVQAGLGLFAEAGHGFGQGFAADGEGAVVHGHDVAGREHVCRLQSLLGIHVDGTTAGRFVGADGHEGDVHSGPLSDVLEAIKERAVTAVEDGLPAATFRDEVPAELAIGVVDESGAPVLGRGEGDVQIPHTEGLPVVHLDDLAEGAVFYNAAHALRYDDRLAGRNGTQTWKVKVIEVGMRDKHQIDVGQVPRNQAGVADPFDGAEPECPDGVDEDVFAAELQKKTGVSEPGHTGLVDFQVSMEGMLAPGLTRRQEVGDEHIIEELEVALPPSLAGQQAHLVAIGSSCGTALSAGGGLLAERAKVKVVKHLQRGMRAGKVPKPLESLDILAQGGKESFQAYPPSPAMPGDDTFPAAKRELRGIIREKMRGVTLDVRSIWSAAVVEHLCQRPDWVREDGVVTLFGGMASEPNLLPLLPWLRERGMRVAFFAIEGGAMTPYLVQDEQDLVPGKLGVLEPWREARARLSLSDITVAFVPGMAFSLVDGTRLGRGKGYYDRALAQMQDTTRCIGVCYHAQLMPSVPREPHDHSMQHVVTEQGWHGVGV